MRTLNKSCILAWKYLGGSREVAGLQRDVPGHLDLAGGYPLEAVMLVNVLPISVWDGATVHEYVENGVVAVIMRVWKRQARLCVQCES